MFAQQRIRSRLAFAIVLTALIPVTAAIVLARSMVQQSSERFFVPEIRERLEQSLEAYRELASATKAAMRHQASALAMDGTLARAWAVRDDASLKRRLERLIQENPSLVSVSVVTENGDDVASSHRGRPVDEAREHQLTVSRPLGSAATRPHGAGDAGSPREGTAPEPDGTLIATAGSPARLVALFATSKQRFDQFQGLGEFIDAYAVLEEERDSVEENYVLAFAALLGITIVLAVGAGTLLARGVATRLSELALATKKVAAGDLTIRVDEAGRDEIADLGFAFNRMLEEVDESRNRIEYLSRLASWQEMARRLAHEIKNPLTPIQLAVQEVHERLSKLGPDQRQLLDATLEIVESEVQTLRRLVGEFSEFARLPQSKTEEADLHEFLQEVAAQSDGRPEYFDTSKELDATIRFEVPEEPAPAELDLQMLRRALVNLVRNALQACRKQTHAEVVVSARTTAKAYEIWVDDDGPGVPRKLRNQVFEPYVTTKDDGTGLGLAIVKKIVIDHGGIIEMTQSDLGGARVRIQLPRVRGSLLENP